MIRTALAFLALSACAAPPPFYSDKSDLLYYLDGQAHRHAVRSKRDWAKRRSHILAGMELVMGALPPRSTQTLVVEKLEEVRATSYTRIKLTYLAEEGDRVPAYLLVPHNRKGRLPAMLCLHQTTRPGKAEPAGLAGLPNLHYAHELAERGYVALAPDYPSFGDYAYKFDSPNYVSGTMKGIVNHRRAVDLLVSLPEVDPERIGVIGHSLGGHNSLFVAAFDERIKAVVYKANNPPPMLLHLKNARIFEEKGQLVEAVREAMLAMETNPRSSRPIRELGHLYHKQGDIAQAEKYYLKAARMNPMDVFAFHSLGDLAIKKGEMDKAAQHYEQAMRISPRNLERGLNFAKILLEKDMAAKAIKVFDKILDLAEDPITVREDIASLCTSKGVYDYAIELYGFILKNMPGRHDIMVKLVDAYDRTGEGRKAMPYLLELEKSTEKDVGLLLKIARIYLSIHQNARADQVLQKVMRIDAGNREAKELISQCL